MSVSDLDDVASAVSVCGDCSLCRTAMNRVFGTGAPNAKVVFVGDVPNADENRTGRPFSDRSGDFIDAVLDKLGLSRDDVYLCNVLKAFPLGNRKPTKEEFSACLKYLEKQISAIAPKVVVALGATPAKILLDTPMSIGKLRGKVLAGPSGTLVVPTYNPRYILYRDNKKAFRALAREFLADIKDAFELADVEVHEKSDADA